MRRPMLVATLVALAGVGTVPALSAQTRPGRPTESVRVVSDAAALIPQLNRSISLNLSGVSVEQALREIGRRAEDAALLYFFYFFNFHPNVIYV